MGRISGLFSLIIIFSRTLSAQDIPVSFQDQSDLIRFKHLINEYGENFSFCLRPIVQNDSIESRLGFSNLSLFQSVLPKWGELKLLQPQVYSQFNQHHPYGWSNGPVIPNKGLQFFGTAGLYLRLFVLEFQYKPEVVRAQNRPFLMPNVRPVQIDFPDRFGNSSYRFTGLGQSFARLNVGRLRVGLSNENIWWGPGQYNSILLSNNAPGFLHLGVETSKPIKTPIGSFEAQIIGGEMRFSGYQYDRQFSPNPLDVPVRDTIQDKYFKNFNGALFTYSPKFLDGMSMGVGRSIFYAQDSVRRIGDLLQVLIPILKEQSGEDGKSRNQVVSFFFRQRFKESNAEFYFEYGREDAAWDLEDLITEPEHTRAYIIGGRKAYPLPNSHTWLDFSAEITQIQSGMSLISRARNYSFYTHPLSGGYTHYGQVLGAGIGPGSNMQSASLTFRDGLNSLGFKLERVVYNNDLFYTSMPNLVLIPPYFVDATKHYIDIGGILSYSRTTDAFSYNLSLHGLQTYNYQWNYDPNGTAGVFRFPGLNTFSFNITANVIYRFKKSGI